MRNLLDSPSPVDCDCYDNHTDAHTGGFGLPLSIQDEINAFDDEVNMLRAQEELAEEPEPEPAKKAYTLSIGIAPRNKYAAAVITPAGRRVKAGTFKREADAWGAAKMLAKALEAKGA